MKLDKWDKQKRHSKVCSVIGGDGDLYIGYEGQVPVLARVLLELYFDYKQNAEVTRDMEGALGRRIAKYYKILEEIEITPEVALRISEKGVSKVS